jgi:L-serine dehydratase
MAVSVFDLFSIGIGPSSSHTVGPMRAAGRFARHLATDGLLPNVARVRIELYGSLGATGAGHGTPGAVVLGLEGSEPETVDPAVAKARVEEINAGGELLLAGTHSIQFDHAADIVLSLRAMDFHSNGMVFSALNSVGEELSRRVYYSVWRVRRRRTGGRVRPAGGCRRSVSVQHGRGARAAGDGERLHHRRTDGTQ